MTGQRSKALQQFLLDTAADGYADAHAPVTRPPDGSHDLVIKRDQYILHDNWFGGEPFGGREVVKDEDKTFWMMVYYGAINDPAEKPGDVYVALREALAKPEQTMPIRGPRHYQASNGYSYDFTWDGDLTRFSGKESINSPQGKTVYQCEVSGGMVDL